MPRSSVFIVGLARTGSTILRHALNRSPQVCIASETHFIRRARRLHLARRLAAGQRGDPASLEGVLDELYERSAWPFIRKNVARDQLRGRLSRIEPTDRAIFALFLEMYAGHWCRSATGTVIVGEKTPSHLADLPTLLEWFPEARIIHTFRDPRAIYASSLRRVQEGRWGPKQLAPWAPASLMDPLLVPFQLGRTSVAWLAAVRRHRQLVQTLGSRYRLVRFEDLVSDPERELRACCDTLGVPFERSMIDDVRVVSSSYSSRKHGTPGFDPAAAQRWRSEVDGPARRWFELVAGREMVRFGYRDA